jgi:hypothetical protein
VCCVCVSEVLEALTLAVVVSKTLTKGVYNEGSNYSTISVASTILVPSYSLVLVLLANSLLFLLVNIRVYCGVNTNHNIRNSKALVLTFSYHVIVVRSAVQSNYNYTRKKCENH